MTPVHLPGVPAPEFPAVWTGIPRRAAGYTAAQLREYATEAVIMERSRFLALADKWDRQSAGCFTDRANAVSSCADQIRVLLTPSETNSER